MELKALWQDRLRHVQVVQTVGLLAYLTEEVRVLILVVFMVMTVAEFVASTVAATLDSVDEMVLTEQRQGTEHVRLVDSTYPALYFCQ